MLHHLITFVLQINKTVYCSSHEIEERTWQSEIYKDSLKLGNSIRKISLVYLKFIYSISLNVPKDMSEDIPLISEKNISLNSEGGFTSRLKI